jgi:RNA polymerase sigma-70 factor, ECF subfamily
MARRSPRTGNVWVDLAREAASAGEQARLAELKGVVTANGEALGQIAADHQVKPEELEREAGYVCWDRRLRLPEGCPWDALAPLVGQVARDLGLGTLYGNGDSNAFRTLMSLHEPKLQAVLSRFGFPPEDAEDVTQKVWQKAWAARGKFTTGRYFGGYLCTIAINAARDHMRKRARLREVRMPAGQPEGTTDPDPPAGELCEALTALIEECLNDRDKSILRRHYLGNPPATYAELGAELGVNPSTVCRWAEQALEVLRERGADLLDK